jgi:hypothetical protein
MRIWGSAHRPPYWGLRSCRLRCGFAIHRRHSEEGVLALVVPYVTAASAKTCNNPLQPYGSAAIEKVTLSQGRRGDSAVKTGQPLSGPSVLAEILLNTLAVLVAVAIVVFPSYSGLYGATKRADRGATEAISAGWQRRWIPLDQADQGPRRISGPTTSSMPAMRSSQSG